MILYMLIFCYTNTIASCQVVTQLPNAATCDTIVARLKVKRPAARLEDCIAYTSATSSSNPTNYLTAQ